MLETAGDILMSPLAIMFYASIISAIWAIPRVRKFREDIRNSRFGDVWDAVVESVQETYREYVRRCKKAKEDGKLTDSERNMARQKAYEKAIYKINKRAPKALANLGRKTLMSLIEDAVAEEKRKGG